MGGGGRGIEREKGGEVLGGWRGESARARVSEREGAMKGLQMMRGLKGEVQETYIHIHTYIHTCIYTHVSYVYTIHTYIHTYIHIHTYMHTYIYTHTHTHTHIVQVSDCLCVYVCLRVRLCVYSGGIHIHTYISGGYIHIYSGYIHIYT